MRRITAVVLCLLAFGACSNDDDGSGASGDTTTTAPTAVTTTTTTKPNGPATTPDAAAQGLFDAWRDGDRDAASRYGRPGAIEELFAHPNTGDVDYMDQGCQPEGGQFICSWTYPGGALHMTIENLPGGGFVVDDVTYTAD